MLKIFVYLNLCKKQVSMTKKCNIITDHWSQTNQWHHEEDDTEH